MKLKETNKGDIEMTLTPKEYEMFRLVMMHVRLGDRNESTNVLSDMAITASEFDGSKFDHERVWFTTEDEEGFLTVVNDVTIEID